MPTRLIKVGYLLIGVGIGVLASSFILAYEFDKPIGEIEEFIPEDNNDISNTEKDDSEDSSNSPSSNSQDSNDIWNGRAGNGDRQRNNVGGPSSGDSGEEDHQEFSSNQSKVLDFYESFAGHIPEEQRESEDQPEHSTRRQEFDKMREEGNSNLSVKYHKMFKTKSNDTGKREVTDILHEVSSRTDTKDSYALWDKKPETTVVNEFEDDAPSDDDVDEYPPGEIDIHEEYVLERVEENIEIYLDDNPIDFVTLIFYQGDETLCDDGEQIIPNPEEVVGTVALNRLVEGGPGADDGIIFVRNLKTSINYEIVLDMGCYSETVLGMFEERHNRLNNGGGLDGRS